MIRKVISITCILLCCTLVKPPEVKHTYSKPITISTTVIRPQPQTSRGVSKGTSFPYTDEEIKLLQRLVYAEANAECFEGKIAIVNVVLNRVKSSKFPNTIKEVLYQKGQFTSVSNGHINYKPDEECLRAVMEALKGINVVGDAVFFWNPKYGNIKGVRIIKKIEDHVFAKL